MERYGYRRHNPPGQVPAFRDPPGREFRAVPDPHTRSARSAPITGVRVSPASIYLLNHPGALVTSIRLFITSCAVYCWIRIIQSGHYGQVCHCAVASAPPIINIQAARPIAPFCRFRVWLARRIIILFRLRYRLHQALHFANSPPLLFSRCIIAATPAHAFSAAARPHYSLRAYLFRCQIRPFASRLLISAVNSRVYLRH